MNAPLWMLAASLVAGQPQVEAAQEPAKPAMKRETAYGMTMGGTAGLLVFTWAAGMTGATLLDRNGPLDREIGRALPIPILGPFVATNIARQGGDDSGPLYAMMGIQQLAAVSVLTIGAIGVKHHRAYDRARGVQRHVSRGATTTMIATGLTGAGIVYGLSLGLTTEPRRRGQAFGRRFAIPVVGGFAAARFAPGYRAGAGALTSSAIQLAGVGAAAAGIALAVRRQRQHRNVVVFPMIHRGHALVTATLRF